MLNCAEEWRGTLSAFERDVKQEEKQGHSCYQQEQAWEGAASIFEFGLRLGFRRFV